MSPSEVEDAAAKLLGLRQYQKTTLATLLPQLLKQSSLAQKSGAGATAEDNRAPAAFGSKTWRSLSLHLSFWSAYALHKERGQMAPLFR